MLEAERLAYQYCTQSPQLGQILIRDGKKGILFTGPDSPPGGEFIPFDNLGYNESLGFFKRSEFPAVKSL